MTPRRSKEHSFAIKGLWGRIKGIGAMVVYIFTQDQADDPAIVYKPKPGKYYCWCGNGPFDHSYDCSKCTHEDLDHGISRTAP